MRASRRAEGGDALPDENRLHEHEPAELASGEVDLADAQLAVGRPAETKGEGGATAGELRDGTAAETGSVAGDARDARAERAAAGVAAAGTREVERRQGSRFGNFLRGSWRELERVQWPDRRQVAQATAVVVGFVLLSGGFLGAADWLSARIVDLIV